MQTDDFEQLKRTHWGTLTSLLGDSSGVANRISSFDRQSILMERTKHDLLMKHKLMKVKLDQMSNSLIEADTRHSGKVGQSGQFFFSPQSEKPSIFNQTQRSPFNKIMKSVDFSPQRSSIDTMGATTTGEMRRNNYTMLQSGKNSHRPKTYQKNNVRQMVTSKCKKIIANHNLQKPEISRNHDPQTSKSIFSNSLNIDRSILILPQMNTPVYNFTIATPSNRPDIFTPVTQEIKYSLLNDNTSANTISYPNELNNSSRNPNPQKTFVYQSPQNAINIRSKNKSVTIDQKFISGKYKESINKKPYRLPEKKVKKQIINWEQQPTYLRPLSMSLDFDHIKKQYKQNNYSLDKYEYRGPPEYIRTQQQIDDMNKLASLKKEKKVEQKNIDPLQQNLKELKDQYIENANMVTKDNTLQTTCLNMLRAFETQKINAGGTSLDTSKRIQDQYLDIAQNYGTRNEHSGIQDYMDPNSEDRQLQKFHFVLNNDKLKALSKNYVQKTFRGMKASSLIKQKHLHQWIKSHGMNKKIFKQREIKGLLNEVFTAIDEDGSGALDTEELIKALLCMGLSKDVDFAKRIIKVFKENQQKEQTRIRKIKESKGDFLDPIIPNQEPQFTLKDFLMAFGLDEVGEKIIFAINSEIDLKNKIKKAQEEKQLQEETVEEKIPQEDDIVLENSIRKEVKEEILKYLSFAQYENEKQGSLQKSKSKMSNSARSNTINFKLSDLSAYGRQLHDLILKQYEKKKVVKKTQQNLKSKSKSVSKNTQFRDDKSHHFSDDTSFCSASSFSENSSILEEPETPQETPLDVHTNDSPLKKTTISKGNKNYQKYLNSVKEEHQLTQDQIDAIRKLRNDFNNQRALKQMANQVKGKVKKIIEDKTHHSIEDQSMIVEGWWKYIAGVYNPKISHTFVRDIPTGIVSKFLIEKAIVQDEYNAHQLFIKDIGHENDHVFKNPMIKWEEFMQIFSSRMFKHALLLIVNRIAGSHVDDSLVLKISQFQRKFMINLNTQSDRLGSTVMKSLDHIKAQEQMKRKNAKMEAKQILKTTESADTIGESSSDGNPLNDEDDEGNAPKAGNDGLFQSLVGQSANLIKNKKNLTYEEFLDDAFGLKKQAKQKEIQDQKIAQQLIQQQQAAQLVTDSSPLPKITEDEENEDLFETEIPEAVILTMSPNIQKREKFKNFQERQAKQIQRTNKGHYNNKPITIEAAGFVSSKKTFVEQQFDPIYIPRVHEIYKKNPAQKIVDKTLNLNMYQDSLGTNQIIYKKKRHDIEEETRDLSDSGDFPERVTVQLDTKNPFQNVIEK